LQPGVIDSPDIPLNVSRSYLQSDSNVKKISSHITKKVADRLQDIFKNDRAQFEEKWDSLRLFIVYGMLTDEKFYERAEKFVLFKNTEQKCFTFDEYKTLIKDNQTDKEGSLIYLYANDVQNQHSYIEAARNKGYDVLLMDGQLDIHWVSQLEQKFEKSRFVRVDSDIIERLIRKSDDPQHQLSESQRQALTSLFETQLPALDKIEFSVSLEQMSPDAQPLVITQNEFMRRMKEMSATQGGGMMSFYGELPDNYTLAVNTTHPLIEKLLREEEQACAEKVAPFEAEIKLVTERIEALKAGHKGKKDEEIPQGEKEEITALEKQQTEAKQQQKEVIAQFAASQPSVGQLIDLALLSTNLLKGEALSRFVKRSVEIMK
jgi:molecular chaperone HtpG